MDDALAKVGKLLFGRPTRLAVGIHLATQDGPWYLTEIATDLRLPISAVAQELAKFTELGWVMKNELTADRRVYYVRQASPWWAMLELAAEIAASVSEGAEGALVSDGAQR